MKISVECSNVVGEQRHFWQSTGFTPAKLLLRPDMAQTLAYVGSVPFGGVTHVRIHFLLDLVRGKGFETAEPEYDWTDLDAGMDVLVRNGLKPFFELMGNPSGFFSDFCNDGQLHAWRRLVRDLALHLQEQYGREEVESWYFETWNEPDGGWWHQWPQEVPFCNYYDACSEGLKEANPRIRFGGPGTCKHLSGLLKAILAHCDSGKNYFTGETGVRLDFVSVHEKGARASPEDIGPDCRGITEREVAVLDYLRENHPRLRDGPLMNNECDPIVGWSQIHTWHARPYYAALICRVINQHQRRLIEEKECNYPVLSNDNGFMGAWGMRTHLVRFGGEKQLERGEFDLIKKPALNVMAMLALLGEARLAVDGCGDPMDENVGVMATRRGEDQVAVLVYHNCDKIMSSGSETIELEITGIPFEQAACVHYRIGEEQADPFVLWERGGAPRTPDSELLARLRDCDELALLEHTQVQPIENGSYRAGFELPLHAVSLLLLTKKPQNGPAKIDGLRAEQYRGTAACENVMLLWQGSPSRSLFTYEVLFSESAEGPYCRINTPDTICSGFLHARRTSSGVGYYRVRAVDQWGRTGGESDTLMV